MGGKPLIRHVVDAARQIVPPEDVYVIVGHEAGLVKDSVAALGVQFVEQTEQRGHRAMLSRRLGRRRRDMRT